MIAMRELLSRSCFALAVEAFPGAALSATLSTVLFGSSCAVGCAERIAIGACQSLPCSSTCANAHVSPFMHLFSNQNLQGFVLQAFDIAFATGGGTSLILAGEVGRVLDA